MTRRVAAWVKRGNAGGAALAPEREIFDGLPRLASLFVALLAADRAPAGVRRIAPRPSACSGSLSCSCLPSSICNGPDGLGQFGGQCALVSQDAVFCGYQ